MIPIYPTTFPPSNTPITDDSGNMSQPGMAFFRAIYNRTGQGSGLVNQVGANVLADNSTITNDWNYVTSTGQLTLPSLTGGQLCMIYNANLAALVTINAPSGATIDGVGSYSLAASKMQIFWFISSSIIVSTQLG